MRLLPAFFAALPAPSNASDQVSLTHAHTHVRTPEAKEDMGCSPP